MVCPSHAQDEGCIRPGDHQRRRGDYPDPPPPTSFGPRSHRGKKVKFAKKKVIWAIFGTQSFGSPPPPVLSSNASHAQAPVPALPPLVTRFQFPFSGRDPFVKQRYAFSQKGVALKWHRERVGPLSGALIQSLCALRSLKRPAPDGTSFLGPGSSRHIANCRPFRTQPRAQPPNAH